MPMCGPEIMIFAEQKYPLLLLKSLKSLKIHRFSWLNPMF